MFDTREIGVLSEHDNGEQTLDEKKLEITRFVDGLRYLDDLDKYWARAKDAPQLLSEGVSLETLKDKYKFYDDLAALEVQILENVSKEKHQDIRNIIRRITSKPSQGREREMKLEHVLKIKRTVEALRQHQTSLQFLVKQHVTSGDVHFGVAQILHKEAFEEARKVFSDRFWRLTDEMTPDDFPNFTTEFNFALQETFVETQALEGLKKWSEKLKSAALRDATEIVAVLFSEDQRLSEMATIKQLSEQKPAKILACLLALKKRQEKHKEAARRDLNQVKKYVSDRDPKSAHRELEEMRKRYGGNIAEVFHEEKFVAKLMLTLTRVKKLEDQIASQKDDRKKAQLIEQLRELQKDDNFVLPQHPGKKEASDFIEAINQARRQGDLGSAESFARKLMKFDRARGTRTLADIQREKQTADISEERKSETNNIETSETKELKIEFLEKCIEHAESVIEACNELGIPKDSADFWGLEGVRNRVAWLKKNGLWHTYQTFNQSDRNMPSREYAGGFRFRWLDMRTGTNLTYSRAENGIEYLNRYEESGYPLAALAGAFSVNWKGASSPVYTPERFTSLANEELSRIRGTSAEKLSKAA